MTESGRVVGIVSVQNLMSSMSLLAEQRRIEREEAGKLKLRWKAAAPNLDSRPGFTWSPRPSAIWATSRCAPSTF